MSPLYNVVFVVSKFLSSVSINWSYRSITKLVFSKSILVRMAIVSSLCLANLSKSNSQISYAELLSFWVNVVALKNTSSQNQYLFSFINWCCSTGLIAFKITFLFSTFHYFPFRAVEVLFSFSLRFPVARVFFSPSKLPIRDNFLMVSAHSSTSPVVGAYQLVSVLWLSFLQVSELYNLKRNLRFCTSLDM